MAPSDPQTAASVPVIEAQMDPVLPERRESPANSSGPVRHRAAEDNVSSSACVEMDRTKAFKPLADIATMVTDTSQESEPLVVGTNEEIADTSMPLQTNQPLVGMRRRHSSVRFPAIMDSYILI